MAARRGIRYAWQGGGMLRATTAHALPDVPRNFDLEDAARVLAWLNTAWRHDALREALLLASPQLHQRIDALTRERCPAVRQLRRAVLSLTSYLLRWDGRTTPFGLFAGVAGIQVGAEAQYSWGGSHRVHVRPDAVWLADILQRLEKQSELRERLPFVVNNAGHQRGNRFVVPGVPDAWAGEFAPVEVSVEVTRPVALVLDAAQRPCIYGELHGDLSTRFPSATGNDIARVLDGLIAEGVLLSSLRAPMTDLAPSGTCVNSSTQCKRTRSRTFRTSCTVSAPCTINSLSDNADQPRRWPQHSRTCGR